MFPPFRDIVIEHLGRSIERREISESLFEVAFRAVLDRGREKEAADDVEVAIRVVLDQKVLADLRALDHLETTNLHKVLADIAEQYSLSESEPFNRLAAMLGLWDFLIPPPDQEILAAARDAALLLQENSDSDIRGPAQRQVDPPEVDVRQVLDALYKRGHSQEAALAGVERLVKEGVLEGSVYEGDRVFIRRADGLWAWEFQSRPQPTSVEAPGEMPDVTNAKPEPAAPEPGPVAANKIEPACPKHDPAPGAVLADDETQGDKSHSPDPAHSDDFRTVNWYGTQYTFSFLQAQCVQGLWENWKKGTPEVSQHFLLGDAKSKRLHDIFKKHPAWKVMIVSGSTKGAYRLQPPPLAS